VLYFANREPVLLLYLVLIVLKSIEDVYPLLVREQRTEELPTKFVLKNKDLARTVVSYKEVEQIL
jgi:hypothetical protein